jgi:hypothetical protein
VLAERARDEELDGLPVPATLGPAALKRLFGRRIAI